MMKKLIISFLNREKINKHAFEAYTPNENFLTHLTYIQV